MEARIEQIYSSIGAMQTQIRSQFKVALLQQPRNIRSLKVEDFYYENQDTNVDLTVECAKVAVSVSNSISNEVKTTVKEAASTKKATSRRTTKKKSSILAQGPTLTGTRKSTRKRMAPSWVSETPLASSTLTAAALGGFETAKSTRSRGRTTSSNAIATPGPSFGFPSMVTPKFDPMTPLNKTCTRTAKADEKFLLSMNGSPVYVGGRGAKAKKENLIPVPIGEGKTLMVPADNPDVQPIIQKLISSCLNIMSKK